MDWNLAGYKLASGEENGIFGLFDPATGFYMMRDIECDGADVILTLTRDRHVIYDAGYSVPSLGPKFPDEGRRKLDTKGLASLKTGKGVAIGDPTSRVRSKLGHPTTIKHTGDRKQYLTYEYKWTDKSNGDRADYIETYTFRDNKLIEIIFDQEAGPH